MTKPLVIDFHAHMLEKEVLAQAQGKTVLSGFGTRPPPIVTGPARTAKAKSAFPAERLAVRRTACYPDRP